MRLSYKALMLSADKAIESTEIEEEPSKFEKWLDDKFGDKLVKVMMVIASILGVALAVGLFFFVPSFLFDLSANVVPAFKGDGGNAVFWKSVFEGVLKIILFLLYIIVCSQMTDMKGCLCTTVPSTRQFSVTKTKKNSQLKMLKAEPFSPEMRNKLYGSYADCRHSCRSFRSCCTFRNRILRPVFKILLLPVSCGIGYELIKICGKHDNAATRIIAAPGLWAQRITTKEPDDTMIEVAIEAIKAVIPEDGSDIVSK